MLAHRTIKLCNRFRAIRSAIRTATTLRHVPYESNLNKTAVKEDGNLQTIPSNADVVVIGGGSIGCSTAYHLAKLKGANVVLIEKDRLTSGTTWHTAGLVWRLQSNHIPVELCNYTADLMTKILPEETGLDTGWIKTGGMFIASNKERLDDYMRMCTLGKVYGLDSYVLSPDEAVKVHPLMNQNDLYGVLYSPEDGTMDPAGACISYTRAATKYGAKIVENCTVNDIITKEDDFGVKRISGVETSLGPISTKYVVNCAGVWAPYIGAMANVYVPQVAYRHAYVVTEHIDGIIDCPNIRDHDGSVYLKRQGDTLQVGGYEPNPIMIKKMEKNFSFGLYDLDWDVFEQHILAACNRVPVIEQTGIRSTVCGPESFTVDGNPLLGEAPELRGFYHGSAFNSGGMMLGGGCGRELAHWIIDGKPNMDLFEMDIRRFPRTLANKKTWLEQRSHETYAKHYSIAFPNDQPLGGRNQRKDGLFDDLSKQGAYFEERHGWERPAYFVPGSTDLSIEPYDYYGSYDNTPHEKYPYRDQVEKDYTFGFPPGVFEIIGTECLNCRTDVALFDISYFGKLFISGPDVDKLAKRIFTRDVTSEKKVGKCTYNLMLNQDGGIEADLIVASMRNKNNEPIYYMSVGGVTTEYCKSHVIRIIQDEKYDCTIEDKTDTNGIISLQGPKSREILMSVMDNKEAVRKLKFSSWITGVIGGCDVTVMRLSFVGELGYELHCSNNDISKIMRELDNASENKIIPKAGFRAMDSLSSEIGFHHWPHTIRSDDDVFESNLSHLCELDNPASTFLGKEALLKKQNLPLLKKLAVFTINNQLPLYGHEAIFKNGKPVGYVRSASYCFALKKSIAYGYVKMSSKNDENISNSDDFKIERMGVQYKATFHDKNPFDPKFDRIRGKYNTEDQERLKTELKRMQNLKMEF